MRACVQAAEATAAEATAAEAQTVHQYTPAPAGPPVRIHVPHPKFFSFFQFPLVARPKFGNLQTRIPQIWLRLWSIFVGVLLKIVLEISFIAFLLLFFVCLSDLFESVLSNYDEKDNLR